MHTIAIIGPMPLTPIQPPLWPEPRGYVHGVGGQGRLLLLSGQIGADLQGRLAEGFVAQYIQALRNIETLLRAAGAGPADLARLTWYLPDLGLYRRHIAELGPAWLRVMGRSYPAITILGVAGLLEQGALLEIEATAVVTG